MDWHISGTYCLDGLVRNNPSAYLQAQGFTYPEAQAYLRLLKKTTPFTLVRQKIEKGFTQGGYAFDINGIPILPKNPSAICWCLLGAIDAVSDLRQIIFMQKCLEGHLHQSIPAFNDTHTKEEVLHALDKVIEDETS